MPESKVELIISGGINFDPEILTKQISMTPDIVWKIGDHIGKTIMTRKESAWVLSNDYSENIDISDLLVKLLVKVRPVKDKIINFISSQEDISLQICVVSYVSDQSPEINFDTNIISELSTLGASLDVDIILE